MTDREFLYALQALLSSKNIGSYHLYLIVKALTEQQIITMEKENTDNPLE